VSLNNDKFNIKTVHVSPDSCLIASGDEKYVKIWDINKQIPIMNYNEHLNSINCVRWGPDGIYFASSSNDHKIKLYDIRCNKSIQHIDAHTNAVTSISFHPSKQYLVSCSLDSTIKIWDLFNNILLYTLYGHEGPIYSLSFNKNGEFICSGGTDANLYIWRSNLNGNLIPKNNIIMGEQDYPDSGKIPNDERKKYHLRSKSSNKISVNMRNTNYTDFPVYKYNDYNNKNRQSNSKNSNIISTNIDSKKINIKKKNNSKLNNNLFSNEMSQNIQTMINKLDNASVTIQKMNERMNILEKQLNELYNIPKDKFDNSQNKELINIKSNSINLVKENEELHPNPQALKDALDYYQNMIKKNNNDNPVEIFEDVNNHVEDIRQAAINNNNQN
jgi:centriolar protein POC1